jgi:hypothetical protein
VVRTHFLSLGAQASEGNAQYITYFTSTPPACDPHPFDVDNLILSDLRTFYVHEFPTPPPNICHHGSGTDDPSGCKLSSHASLTSTQRNKQQHNIHARQASYKWHIK